MLDELKAWISAAIANVTMGMSGKMWTIDGMYAELQMALTANHSTNNFSNCV
jgi:hypothetical protein